MTLARFLLIKMMKEKWESCRSHQTDGRVFVAPGENVGHGAHLLPELPRLKEIGAAWIRLAIMNQWSE